MKRDIIEKQGTNFTVFHIIQVAVFQSREIQWVAALKDEANKESSTLQLMV